MPEVDAGAFPQVLSPLESTQLEQQRKQAAVTRAEEVERLMTSAEDELFTMAEDIVRGAMRFSEVVEDADGNPQPPPEWASECRGDPAKSRRMLALAVAGGKSVRSAPIGIQVAAKVHASITAARARVKASKGGNVQQLNVAIFQLAEPMPQFERRDDDGSRDKR